MKKHTTFGLLITVLILVFTAACGNKTATNNSAGNANSLPSITPTVTSISNSSLSGDEKKHYNSCEGDSDKSCFEFSFDYPGTWELTSDEEQGFKSITISGKERSITFYKNFTSFGTVADDRYLYFDEFVDADLKAPGRNGKRISCGATSIHSYKGYECRFKASGEQNFIVRWITLPQKIEKTVLMRIRSSVSEEITDKKLFDNNPELLLVLNSLKIGS